MSGRKYDQEKARFDLLDPCFIEAMAEVMTYGAQKYAPNNWQKVEDFKARYTAALHRHLNAWQQGEERDEESNLYHLAQVSCNAMFLFWEEQNDSKNLRRRESVDTTSHYAPGSIGAIRIKADNV